MHTNKIRQSSQSKTTKIKQGNKRDLFDTSLINTTAILSDKYLSRPSQFFNEWEKQKGIQRHNKRHLANPLSKTQIRIFEIWKQKSDPRTTDQNNDTSTTEKEWKKTNDRPRPCRYQHVTPSQIKRSKNIRSYPIFPPILPTQRLDLEKQPTRVWDTN